MRFLEGSPEPIAHAAIDGANRVVHTFNNRTMAEKYAEAGGYKLEAVFRGVPPNTKAAQDVLTERWRQVALEGFDYRHDDRHAGGELAKAAACYASHAASVEAVREAYGPGAVFNAWPFKSVDWKPKDERGTLVVAAALILAEIERLDRKAERDAAAQVIA